MGLSNRAAKPPRRRAVEATADRPPYRVPLLREIAATPWNGLRVASTFAGCGGSSLGYRMAGFRVVWASEFVDIARETYRANADPRTVLDARDIREVQPAEILAAAGIEVGELDILDGSPPCASFSTAGKRERDWGKVKAYSDRKQRTDDLFPEFARLVDGLKPKVFVAENVSGIVKGVAIGWFIRYRDQLAACGYRVRSAMLDAQWLGVPQARPRLIMIGVRDDLALDPEFPTPLPWRYSIRDALGDVGPIRTKDGARSPDLPAPTVQTHGRRGTQSELTWVGALEPGERRSPAERQAADQQRIDRGAYIAPFAIGDEWNRIGPGGQSERFFQLVRPDAGHPSPTITAEGGTPWIASVTHPAEPRKFSIPELRRICGFPDDFVLLGTYAQQWERLGRAVPPPMMRAVAETIRDKILTGERTMPKGKGQKLGKSNPTVKRAYDEINRGATRTQQEPKPGPAARVTKNKAARKVK